MKKVLFVYGKPDRGRTYYSKGNYVYKPEKERIIYRMRCECCRNEFLRRQVREIKGQYFCKPCLDLLWVLVGGVKPRVVEVREEQKCQK